jgi:hypothetical protein
METLKNWGISFVCASYIERISVDDNECSSSFSLQSVVLVVLMAVHEWLCWLTVHVKESATGRLVLFWNRTDCWCISSICDKTATLLNVSRATLSKVMLVYTHHGKTTLNSGQKSTLRERDQCKLGRIVWKITQLLPHRWQQNWSRRWCFHKNCQMWASQIQHPW